MVTAVYSGAGDAAKLADNVVSQLPRLHSLVIGCGLGRQAAVLEGTARVIAAARERGLPIVIDADGLQLIAERPSVIAGYDRALLTPNVMELRKLMGGLGIAHTESEDLASQLISVCRALDGPTVLLKGRQDLISTVAEGSRGGGQAKRYGVVSCMEPGAPRRSGGLGDVLAGTLATLVAWLQPGAGGVGIGGWNLTDAALAGCTLTRRSCCAAFKRRKRAMTAPDVLEELGTVFEELCPAEMTNPKQQMQHKL
ncbi:unnamed protein product [Polarella glacialis]|nr:unnamed protein product [Polarella glacialis]